MITNFNEQLWVDFDLEIAVFLENLVSWLRYNASKDKPEQRNFHDGQYWSYSSYPEFAKHFSGWSSKTMRTIISRCVKSGLLLIGNFNKKKYDNTNWYTLTEKAWAYFQLAASKLYPKPPVDTDIPGSDLNTCAQTGRPPAQTGRPIPENLNSLGNNNIISDLEKSDYSVNHREANSDSANCLDSTGFEQRSDYQKNQIKKETYLSEKEHIFEKRERNTEDSQNPIKDEQILDAYHEILPECPKIKVIDTRLHNQLNHMRKNWPRYQKEGRHFSIDSFKDYLSYIKKHYSWFIKPYTTSNGNLKRNNLRVLTREINITKIVNGEFSVN